MHRFAVVVMFCLACATSVHAQEGPTSDGCDTPDGAFVDARATLLDRERSDDERARAYDLVERCASAGHGTAAAALGALYRLGEHHPARWVERDLDAARRWYRACMAAQHCPLSVLAALAELAIEHGDGREAMAYAQVYAISRRRATEAGDDGDLENLDYEADLLMRAYRLNKGIDDATIQGWIDALASAEREALARMQRRPSAQPGTRSCVPGTTHHYRRARAPRRRNADYAQSGIAFYQVVVDRDGGRARSVAAIDVLPDAGVLKLLDPIAHRLDFEPLAPGCGDRAHLIVPISFDARRYGIERDD